MQTYPGLDIKENEYDKHSILHVNAEPGDESEDIFGDDSEEDIKEKGDADSFDY